VEIDKIVNMILDLLDEHTHETIINCWGMMILIIRFEQLNQFERVVYEMQEISIKVRRCDLHVIFIIHSSLSPLFPIRG